MRRSIVERYVMHSVTDEVRYRLLRYLEEHPQASQRELALHLGVSVGKINYCLRALIEKGLVKMRNFRKSERKLAYSYVLTPKGIDEKVNVTVRFLQRKMVEYDVLSEEIKRLNREVRGSAPEVETDVST
jgi:MarR family transcriptional regulator, temperature-dependent positive regulator of motility